ncbi:MAG: helix-turn-helix domain-containing protein [Oscillospiraceae bacterium]|nr:helix-turn-helix domain-containing protein [Oscillospiraceae bacterium]
MESMKVIGDKLRKFRKKLGLSQFQIAQELNIERSTFAYYELGKTIPDIKTIIKISKILGVHYTELLEEEHAQVLGDVQDQIPNVSNLSIEELKIISLLREKPSGEKKKILENLKNSKLDKIF